MSDPPPSSQQDRHNFSSSSSSSHRLPTVSAAAALASLENEKAAVISTGLPLLDAQLSTAHDGSAAGLVRGQVYEIYGPPASGKTALGLQIATNALMQGAGVAWIDTSHPLAGPRLRDVVRAAVDAPRDDRDQKPVTPAPAALSSPDPSAPRLNADGTLPATHAVLQQLTHVRVPTLAHLLALLLPSDASPFPSEETALVVLDTASALLPPSSSSAPKPKAPGASATQTPPLTAAARRGASRSTLVHAASRLAARRRVAVLLLCSARTVRRPVPLLRTAETPSHQMGLASALGGDERITSPWTNAAATATGGAGWTEKIAARMMVFRDFYIPPPLSSETPSLSHEEEEEPAIDLSTRPASFIALSPSPASSTSSTGAARSIVPFTIDNRGIQALALPLSEIPPPPKPSARTRNLTSLSSPAPGLPPPTPRAPTSTPTPATAQPAIRTARAALQEPSDRNVSLPHRSPSKPALATASATGRAAAADLHASERKRKREAIADSEDEDGLDSDADFDWLEAEAAAAEAVAEAAAEADVEA